MLDLPADVQRADIDIQSAPHFECPVVKNNINVDDTASMIIEAIKAAKHPCILVGNTIKSCGLVEDLKRFIAKVNIPVVFSLPAFDTLPTEHPNNFGFIGANGLRYAGFIAGKCDLLVTLGARLDIRQVSLHRDAFCHQAKIIRVDCDNNELSYKLHEDEVQIKADLRTLLPAMVETAKGSIEKADWISVCNTIKIKLNGYDDAEPNTIIKEFSKTIPDDLSVTIDVGQHELWVAQSSMLKDGQQYFMSAGHGSMGYSLPAAIGVYYATKKPVVAYMGDGGLMMNLQEMQFIARENLPVTIVCVDNNALGMIRGFQDANFNKNFFQTTKNSGFTTPDFAKLAEAFSFGFKRLSNAEDIKSFTPDNAPTFVDLILPEETYLVPAFGKDGLIQDARPYIDRASYNEIMSL